MKIIRLLGFITAFLLLIPVGTLCAQNTVKVKGVQGRWQVSDEITLKQADGECLVGFWPDHSK